MNEASKKIVEKIQKLLSLATSSNENEAKLAASKAQELLLRYNLSSDQINAVQDDYLQDAIPTGRVRKTSEWKYIQSILNEFYFVSVINDRRRAMVNGKMTSEAVYYIFGKPHNVEIAKYVRNFLERSFEELWDKYQLETGKSASSKQSFYLGLYQGLRTQLSSTVKNFSTETGLVVVKDGELAKFVESQIGRTTQTKSNTAANDRDAIESGYDQGKNLKIAQGLTSRSDSRPLALKG